MIKIRNMEFEYFDRDEDGNLTEMINAIRGINFDANRGEIIGIIGRNGSGKSTLARIMNRLLVPVDGTVLIEGLDAKKEENTISIRKKVGMVFQNPDNQLIGSIVSEDVAFGAENIGISHKELTGLVSCCLRRTGLSTNGEEDRAMAMRPINELSGGEKQKVAIAGVLAMKPVCIVLDEATSMLDNTSRSEILNTMRKLADEGITIILITHIMEEALLADRIYVMDMGRIVMHGRRNLIFADEAKLKKYGLECPPAVRAAQSLFKNGVIKTAELYSVDEIISQIKAEHPYAFLRNVTMPVVKYDRRRTKLTSAIIIDKVSYSYRNKEVLKNISFTINKGEYTVIMGRTGAGKSTLSQLIPSFLVPDSGHIYVDGVDVNDKSTDIRKLRCKIGYVFQYPEEQLFECTVYEDVVFGPRNIGVSEVEAEKRAYEAIELAGLSQEIYDIPISKLSGGQKRRVALAGVLAMKPEYLILDEPFAGLDPEGKQEMLRIIDLLHKEAGITVILISHDADSAAAYADRLIVLDNGEVSGEGRPQEVFYDRREEETPIPFVMELLIELRRRGLPVSCGFGADSQNVFTIKSGTEEIIRALGGMPS